MSAKLKTGIAGVCSVAVIVGLVLDNGQVRTPAQGLTLIGDAEGCRRAAYTCPAGRLTDGIGNTHGVIPGHPKTDTQIAADFEQNILAAERCVNRHANGARLPDNVFSAAVSLTFRAGCGTVRDSTLFSLLRAGDIPAACQQFPRWVYGGGHVLPGLVARAEKEKILCLQDLK